MLYILWNSTNIMCIPPGQWNACNLLLKIHYVVCSEYIIMHWVINSRQSGCSLDYFYFIIFVLSLFIYFFICGGFCHTLKWNSQGFTCVPHPDPPSHLPLHPFPLGFPSAPGPSTCLMHPTWAGDLFHPR